MTLFVGVVIGVAAGYVWGHANARTSRARSDLRAAKASVPVARKVFWLLLRRSTWRTLGVLAFVAACAWLAIAGAR